MTTFSWFRFYVGVLDSENVQTLPDWAFRGWVNMLCSARKHNGVLPPLSKFAFELRLSESKASKLLEHLLLAQLLERSQEGLTPKDWNRFQYASDCSTERSRKHRTQQLSNVAGTPSDTDTDTENRTAAAHARTRSISPPPTKAKLTLQDFPRFCELVRHYFPATDDAMLGRILAAAAMADPEITDQVLTKATQTAGKQGQKSAALFVTTVPIVLSSWRKAAP